MMNHQAFPFMKNHVTYLPLTWSKESATNLLLLLIGSKQLSIVRFNNNSIFLETCFTVSSVTRNPNWQFLTNSA